MPTGVEKPAAVTYIGLPVSSGGAHHLGRLTRRSAYVRTRSFLESCTEPLDALEYRLDVLSVPELAPIPSLEREVERRFGFTHAPLAQARKSAAIPATRVGEVLDFLDGIHPQPANRWGMSPVWFWTRAKFRILDPATGLPLPGQDPGRFAGVEYEHGVPLGSSRLRLILSTGAAISIELCLPDADAELRRRVIPWLQEHLPFRFSSHQWRAWAPTRSGTFKARKLTPLDP